MNKVFTKPELNALIDSLVDLCQLFVKEKWRVTIDTADVIEVLSLHGLTPSSTARINNDAPGSEELRDLIDKRQQIFTASERLKLSDEARDESLNKINGEISLIVSAMIFEDDWQKQALSQIRKPQPSDDQESSAEIKTRRKESLQSHPIKAQDFNRIGREVLLKRGQQRGKEEGERSMAKTVAAFNQLFDKDLTITEGYQFMACHKMSRSSFRVYRVDDYVDQQNYSSLAGESAGNEYSEAAGKVETNA